MSDIERGNPSHSDNNFDEKKNQLELYKATLSNDWKKAESIYNKPRMTYGIGITSRGETALHIAALAGHIDFVQNLVHKMSLDEIRIETKSAKSNGATANGKGNTAFHCAVISGNVKIAREIMMKCVDLHDLAMARGIGNNLPINMAAAKGNEEMVRYLFESWYKNYLEALECRDGEDEDRKTLFLSLIKSNIFDIALQMGKALLSRQIAPVEMEEEALQEFAQKPLNTPGYLYRCIHSFSTRQEVVMYENAVELVELLWDSLTLNEERVSALINSPDPNPIIEAAKRGNHKFLSILIASYPDVLFTYDDNKYTIIHHAILNRHVDIFKFIHLGSAKTILTMYRDIQGNNMLHLAAKLSPPNRLNIIPGAALQLQRELLWFKEVKKVMEPHEVNRKKYYLSDFPLEQMLPLVEEMKKVISMDTIEFKEGLYEKLNKVMERENNELKECHPSYKGLWKNEFSPYVLIHDHKSKEELAEVVNGRELNQIDTNTVINSVKKAMGQHQKFRNYVSQLKLLDLFKKINEVMCQYESGQHDIEYLFEKVKKVLRKDPGFFPTFNTQVERVACFFEDIDKNKLLESAGSGTEIFLKNLKKLMENYNDLKENPPRTTKSLRVMSNLFKRIDKLMTQPNDSEHTFENVKKLLERTHSHRHKYKKNKTVLDLFKEMKVVMEQHVQSQNDKSTEEYTPHDVFVKEHKQLMAEGEKWMRDTANSCMIVAVLITTIAFAAAITIPGGNADDGYPHFSRETLFKAFAIADSVSMISSATSLLNFLAILTARYSVDDFRWSLPNKLVTGLLTLFMSVVAMMVAFVLSIFIIFRNSPLVFAIAIAAVSSVPILLFIGQHWRLFVDVFGSTYTSYLLFKPKKDASLLFKEKKGKMNRESLRVM